MNNDVSNAQAYTQNFMQDHLGQQYARDYYDAACCSGSRSRGLSASPEAQRRIRRAEIDAMKSHASMIAGSIDSGQAWVDDRRAQLRQTEERIATMEAQLAHDEEVLARSAQRGNAFQNLLGAMGWAERTEPLAHTEAAHDAADEKELVSV